MNPSVAPEHAASRSRRWAVGGALVLAALAAVVWFVWLRPGPPLPALDLSSADPKVADAITDARAAVVREPNRAEAWGRLGMVLLAHQFAPQALVCFEQASQYEPAAARWLYLAAQIEMTEEPRRSIALLERAAAAEPNNAIVRLLLAEMLLEQGRQDDAEEHFRAILDGPAREMRLTEVRASLGLARLALRRDRLPAALDYAQRARQPARSLRSVSALLMEIHQRSGDAAATERERLAMPQAADPPWPDPYMEEVRRLNVEIHPRITLARDFLAQGRIPDAMALYHEMVSEHPDSAPAWISLGQAHLRLEQWKEAQAATERALALRPREAVALSDLGYALSDQGKFDEAIASYLKAAEANPHDAEIRYHLGYCYLRQGDLPEAVAALRTSVRLRPHFAMGWRELGQCLAQQGETAEAVTCLERAVELAPDDPLARKRLDKLRTKPT